MLTPVTITGTFRNPDDSLASGGLTFVLSQHLNGQWVPTSVMDQSTGEIVTSEPIGAVVDQGRLLVPGPGGYLPLVLLANDDATTVPAGTAYLVTEQLEVAPGGAQLSPWAFVVHATSPGGTQDLSSQRPVP